MSTGSWGAQEPQGAGWYQASDGLWYPPTGGGAGLAAQPPMRPTGSGAPVVLDFDAPLEVARWRPLVAWLLIIPHFVVLWLVMIVAGVCQFIAVFTILFTKQIPPGIQDWIVRAYRYQWQTVSYSLWMHEKYPPWGGQPGEIDPGTEPALLTIVRADELKRFGPLYKWILAIPHCFVLVVLAIAMSVVVLIAFFAVLFTGRWPDGLRKFVVGFYRWSTRVQSYVLLRDEYPPFSLD